MLKAKGFIVQLVFFCSFSLSSPLVFAEETRLENNQLDMKVDRIEQTTTNQNQETTSAADLFDEIENQVYQERVKTKEELEKQEQEQRFTKKTEKVVLYSDKDYFNKSVNEETDTVKPDTQLAAKTNADETEELDSSVLLITGGSLSVLLAGAFVSVTNYRKGA